MVVSFYVEGGGDRRAHTLVKWSQAKKIKWDTNVRIKKVQIIHTKKK